MLAPQHQHASAAQSMEMDAVGFEHLATTLHRKRKAEAQPENNERLSKRLSLLNLEHGGSKLYVPVENSLATTATLAPEDAQLPVPSSSRQSSRHKHRAAPPPSSDELMQVDDSKYKVYIYNIEDELSSESEPEDANSGKLVFLPDIEKHLKANRIPPQLLADPRAEMAGKELVLYSVPRSISVPQEKDSVRKAIIEARTRAREKQIAAQAHSPPEGLQVLDMSAISEIPMIPVDGIPTPVQSNSTAHLEGGDADVDSDAMDLD